MTDAEWADCLRKLDEHEQHIVRWEAEPPNPGAMRCVHSRHRTLAHLRACQETWLEVCLAFEAKPGARLKVLHPWRSFEQRSYESLPWEEHLSVFRSDRVRLKEFLKTADRSKGGKMNANEHTIEALVSRIVSHEHHHLFTPR